MHAPMSETPDYTPMLQALRALSAADGRISQEERAWLRKIFDELEVQEQVAPVIDIERLEQTLPETEDRLDFIRLMLLVSLADGTTSSEEWGIISQVGAQLGVSEDELEELRQTTYLAALPSD